jgi:hypothetical protein
MAKVYSDSPLSEDVFSNYELLFENVVDESAVFVTDANGNPVIQTGPGEAAIRLVATLNPTAKPRVVAMLGADAQKILFEGRCVDPMQIPENLLPGAKAELVIGGVKGIFVLGPVLKSSLIAVQEAIGQGIIGTWASSNHPQGT